MENSNNPLILVTGATGYVASHVIKLLLERGHKVRGTVRSLANKSKNEFLYQLVPEKKDNLELVEADLLKPETWGHAVEGVTYVLHVASPFPSSNPKDENELIKPAVEGTLSVLNAAIEKGVKKVVLTSSLAAVYYGHEGKEVGPDDWSIESSCSPYPKSKLRAERAAWDFWRKHHDKFELTTINPGFIIGPIYSSNSGTSEQVIADFLKGKHPGVPEISLSVVDVRDVAECHLKALFAPNTNGKRYICSSKSLWMIDIANALQSEFGQFGYKIPKRTLGKCLVNIAAIFDKTIRLITPEIGHERICNNELSVKELGMVYRKPEESLTEMGYSLIKAGIVPDKTTDKKSK